MILKILHSCFAVMFCIFICGATLWICIQSPNAFVFLIVYFLLKRRQNDRSKR